MLPSSAEAVSIETNAAAVPAKGPSPAVELPPHALATFGKEPLLARHNLHENPLFSDESKPPELEIQEEADWHEPAPLSTNLPKSNFGMIAWDESASPVRRNNVRSKLI